MGSATIVFFAGLLFLSGSAHQQAGGGRAVHIAFSEWKIDMPTSLVAGIYTLRVTNNGTRPHNLKIKSAGFDKDFPENLKPGETGALTVELKAGRYKVNCPIGFGPMSHGSRGMELVLTVTAAQ